MKYQSTDDAYVETTTVSVSPKVSGQIVKVLVEDNQEVKAGDVVAVIDKVDYQVRLDQAKAAYERALLNQQNAHANLNAANSEIELAQKDGDVFSEYVKQYEAKVCYLMDSEALLSGVAEHYLEHKYTTAFYNLIGNHIWEWLD